MLSDWAVWSLQVCILQVLINFCQIQKLTIVLSRSVSGGPLFKIPFIESLSGIQVLKEINIVINKQSAITKDNVTVDLDGVLYIKVSILLLLIFQRDL